MPFIYLSATLDSMIRERIAAAVKEALSGMGAENARFTVERPGDFAHGDYSTNAALVAGKLLEQAPRTVAEALAAKLGGIEGVAALSVAGPGFINFSLSREAVLPAAHSIPKAYAGKTVLVEYTSPNLFKPLHIGNLIGNILGESLSRLIEATGGEVKRLNYPSDIGPTVAKGVWGLATLKLDPSDIAQLGKAYVAGNAAYEDGSGKAAIDEINQALYEDTHPEWSELRKRGIETSRRHLAALCERLGTRFDKEFFESESGPVGSEIVRANKGKVFEESDGAVVYHGAHTRVFLNSRGLPTYEAKEVGLFDLKSRAYPEFDISLTVTGSEQRDFFLVVFDAIGKIFPERTAGKVMRHVANGFLRLTTGKMSSRLGNVITGESLIEDLTRAARDREDVAIGALKYTVLKSGSGRDITFDPEKSLSLEGDSGPYLQYALVRARSLLRAAKEADIEPGSTDTPTEAGTLERLLVHYAEVVERAALELEPHYLTTYLTELAAAFNSWYASGKVIGGTHPHFGVLLTGAVAATLAEGLSLLAIPAPEEM